MIFTLTFLLSTKVWAEAYLPKDWYVLPENDSSFDLKSLNSITTSATSDLEKRLNSEEGKLQDLNYSFDRILESNEDVFDNLNPNLSSSIIDTQVDTDFNKDSTTTKKKHWGLAKIGSIFTVGASGMLGLISGKGTTSLTLWWFPKPKAVAPTNTTVTTKDVSNVDTNASTSIDSNEGIPTVAIYEEQSDGDLKKELSPIIKMAKIKNKKIDTNILEKNLIKRAKEFRKLAYSLSVVSSSLTSANVVSSDPSQKPMCWYPYKLRCDLAISASGKVLLVPVTVSVGGEISLRMEWIRLQNQNPNSINSSGAKALLPMDKLQLEMQKLTSVVAGNLNRITSKMTSTNKFDFNGIRLAIGMNASGNIFVAKATGSVTGHLYFKKSECKQEKNTVLLKNNSSLENVMDQDILIEADANTRNFEIARSLEIPYVVDVVATSEDDNKSMLTKRAFYKTSAKRFVAGLEKSVKVARFFSNAILKREERRAQKTRWQINKIWSGYALSLTGTVGVATVGGNMQIELEFERKK